MKLSIGIITASIFTLIPLVGVTASLEYKDIKFKAGHKSVQQWVLPKKPPYPEGNKPTKARVELGKMLYFDPRLSGDGNMSCATCHNPMFGWSDGLGTAKGVNSMVLGRASPTIINTAYNSVQMWDGRKKTLEDQATGPLKADVEMNANLPKLLDFLAGSEGYQKAFEEAYPNEGVSEDTLAKAIASYERTVISNKSPFDRWLKGKKKAMTKRQVKGFKLFVNPEKGKCAACHLGPNFTDNGFHNLGLASFGDDEPDLGRHGQIPLNMMKGAFKTPTLRDITTTAPYFHDGSAKTLMDVVNHYVDGGVVKTNLSPNFQKANLDEKEKQLVVEFMQALTSPPMVVTLPVVPLN